MTNKPLLAVGLLAVVLMVLLSYVFGNNEAKILQAQLTMQKLTSQRDSISAVVAIKDSMQRIIQILINQQQTEADSLKSDVSHLEQEREDAQLSVRKLRKDEDLQKKFIDTFPEIAGSDWGVQDVYNEKADLDIQYLLVPFSFGETFIIDHENALNYKAQRDLLQVVDSLRVSVIALQDSVLHLEEQKSSAYKQGYDTAYSEFTDLNREYIDELRKPNFGVPHWAAIVGGIGVGILIGK